MPKVSLNNSGFGYSLRIYENFIAVGSPLYGNNEIKTGAVYIFDINLIEYERIIIPTDGENLDSFGKAIDICKDLIIVGSIDAKGHNQIRSGAIYLYSLTDDSFEEKIFSENSKLDDKFGYSVGIFNSTFVIGSPQSVPENQIPNNWGSIFIYN